MQLCPFCGNELKEKSAGGWDCQCGEVRPDREKGTGGKGIHGRPCPAWSLSPLLLACLICPGPVCSGAFAFKATFCPGPWERSCPDVVCITRPRRKRGNC